MTKELLVEYTKRLVKSDDNTSGSLSRIYKWIKNELKKDQKRTIVEFVFQEKEQVGLWLFGDSNFYFNLCENLDKI